jgi:hypothetical protein
MFKREPNANEMRWLHAIYDRRINNGRKREEYTFEDFLEDFWMKYIDVMKKALN